MRNKSKTRGGLILVTVLWVVVLFSIIALTAGRNSRLDTKVCIADVQGCKLKWACWAGTETAVAVLKDDTSVSDSLNDMWAMENEDFNDIELGDCICDVVVIDEASKLNINTASKAQFMALPDMTEDVADSIIDWRDKNDQPQTSGVEAGYYQNLSYPYAIRNDSFQTVRELLMVRGITEEMLYGIASDPLDSGWIDYLTCYSFDSNKDSQGNNRVNVNKADEKRLTSKLDISKSHAKWIVENRPKKGYESIADLINTKSSKKSQQGKKSDSDQAQPIDLQTFYGIVDKLTISDKKRVQGRINVNTASKTVLAVFLGGDEKAEILANNIIDYRMGLVEGMENIGDLSNVEAMDVGTFKKIAESITTRSDVYCIVSTASIAGSDSKVSASMQTEAVIDRTAEKGRILYSYQGVSN